MTQLPYRNDRTYRAIQQRLINTTRSMRASHSKPSADLVALAMLQTAIKDMTQHHKREHVANASYRGRILLLSTTLKAGILERNG